MMTGTARWFWGGFLLLILAGALLVVFAAIRGGQQWAEHQLRQEAGLPPPLREVIEITLSGSQSLYLSPEALARVRQQTGDWLRDSRRQSLATLQVRLDQSLAGPFDSAESRIPHFADWYYSLSGEYLRLYHAVAGDLPDFLGERIRQEVFEPAGTAVALDAMAADLDRQWLQRMAADARAFEGHLTRWLAQNRQQAAPEQLQVVASLDLGAQLQQQLRPLLGLSGKDLGRQGLATGSGALAASLVMKKLGAKLVADTSAAIAAKQSAGMLAALAAKLGIKSAAKGGVLAGAGSGALGGSALCAGSVAGLALTPACALIGGVAAGVTTWVLVDKAVLETDELMNRQQLEQDMKDSLAAQRLALRQRLMARYQAMTDRAYGELGAVVAEEPEP